MAKNKMTSLIRLRDEAFAASQDAHDRIRREISIYNDASYQDGERLGSSIRPLARKSIDPKIANGIIRMRPAMEEQTPRIEVQARQSASEYRTEDDQGLAEDLQNWVEMMEDADGEQNRLSELILYNLVCGNAISKTYYNRKHKIVSSEAIQPTQFAPDPNCTRSDFLDAEYLVHTTWRSERYLRRRYDDLPELMEYGNRIDEMWLEIDVADDAGIDVSAKESAIVLATLCNDKLVRALFMPYWYPHYPFASWRNFTDLRLDKPHSFWGWGYGTFMWPQQKLHDEMLANLILIARNLSIGRFITKHGVLDKERIMAEHGAVIELNPEVVDAIANNIQHLPPEQVPAFLAQFVEFTAGILDGMLPSLSPVYVGDSPHSGASGRTVNSLQYAAFNQLASNVNNMNEFRLRRMRQRCVYTQQFGRNIVEPHLWRGGLNLPDAFPEDARKLNFGLKIPSAGAVPNTPGGRAELASYLANYGAVLTTDKLIEFLGLDRGFGLKANDFIQAPVAPGGGAGGVQVDQTAMSGLEAAVAAEQ